MRFKAVGFGEVATQRLNAADVIANSQSHICKPRGLQTEHEVVFLPFTINQTKTIRRLAARGLLAAGILCCCIAAKRGIVKQKMEPD